MQLLNGDLDLRVLYRIHWKDLQGVPKNYPGIENNY